MISNQHNQCGFRGSGDAPPSVPAARCAITGANLDLPAICQQNEPVRGPSPLSGRALATLTCAALAGCTGGGTSGPAPPAASAHPQPGPRATGPKGSPGNPFVLSCGQEAFPDPPVQQRPRPGDLVIGPLFIVNGRELATADPAGFGDHGAYKIPLVLALGSTATVTIAPAARGHVVIDNPYARLRGVRDLVAATYRACSRRPGFFAQGFGPRGYRRSRWSQLSSSAGAIWAAYA